MKDLPSPQDNQSRELTAIKLALDEAAIVAITDAEGIITHVNEKFCKISQYNREELLGKTHRIINSGYHPKEFFMGLWKTISRGLVWENEICNRAKDGSLYWVNTCIVPFLNPQGIPYQYVSIRYEITQRKNAEAALKSFSQRLEQSNRELEHFASIAAHDLQEPLRKIRAFSDRLQMKHGSHIPEEGLEYLQKIQGSAARMQTLIDDLLAYSRIGTKTLPFEWVSLEEIMKDVISDLEVRIDSTKANIAVGPLPSVEADRSQMRQLFQNLLTNALKFHKPGVPPEIRISAVLEESFVKISIGDNGIGFEQKYAERIFQIFQRLHGRSEYEGTGVGLAICKRIVERHGGTIAVSSQLNQGTEFLLKLSIKQKENSYFEPA